jgi:hypothetical protein
MPNGATSACNDSIQPSRPNFDAAYALTNSKPAARPADEEIEINRHIRGDVFRSKPTALSNRNLSNIGHV